MQLDQRSLFPVVVSTSLVVLGNIFKISDQIPRNAWTSLRLHSRTARNRSHLRVRETNSDRRIHWKDTNHVDH